MRRPLHVALVFAGCVAVLFGAMAYLSVLALRLDHAETQARSQAAYEESVRLALWRMDSKAAPLIARENSRPWYVYSAFYPVEGAYAEDTPANRNRMQEERPAQMRQQAQAESQQVFVPSPVLAPPPGVFMNFEIDSGGRVTSPQAPAAGVEGLQQAQIVGQRSVAAAAERLGEFESALNKEALAALFEKAQDEAVPARVVRPAPAQVAEAVPAAGGKASPARQMAEQQMARNVMEFSARNAAVATNSFLTQSDPLVWQSSNVRLTVMRPVWMNGMLLLVRRVTVDGRPRVQGCDLDWPSIKESLLADVRDLFPNADLVAAEPGGGDNASRTLASLPAVVVPGKAAVGDADASSPLALTLALAWAAVLVAAAAAGVLLYGAVALSERRAAFVSAVTHELRSPLTTFQLYADMLAGGMVADEKRRAEYFATLKSEAERLSHLVENVLAYSRLERGAGASAAETAAVGDLFARSVARLSGRASQAGMTLACDAGEASSALVRVQPAAFEQILFNLVDNAAKYASAAEDQRIHLDAGSGGGRVRISVWDHGPGVAADVRRRLFRPFSKSAREAAHSAPGVGLGLSLSRRLARRMGGRLILEETTAGARFTLVLPEAPRPAAGERGPKAPQPLDIE